MGVILWPLAVWILIPPSIPMIHVCVIRTQNPFGRMFIWCFEFLRLIHHHSIDRRTWWIFMVELNPKPRAYGQKYRKCSRRLKEKFMTGGVTLIVFAFWFVGFGRNQSWALRHQPNRCDWCVEPFVLCDSFKAIQTPDGSKSRHGRPRLLVSCGDVDHRGAFCVSNSMLWAFKTMVGQLTQDLGLTARSWLIMLFNWSYVLLAFIYLMEFIIVLMCAPIFTTHCRFVAVSIRLFWLFWWYWTSRLPANAALWFCLCSLPKRHRAAGHYHVGYLPNSILLPFVSA